MTIRTKYMTKLQFMEQKQKVFSNLIYGMPFVNKCDIFELVLIIKYNCNA